MRRSIVILLLTFLILSMGMTSPVFSKSSQLRLELDDSEFIDLQASAILVNLPQGGDSSTWSWITEGVNMIYDIVDQQSDQRRGSAEFLIVGVDGGFAKIKPSSDILQFDADYILCSLNTGEPLGLWVKKNVREGDAFKFWGREAVFTKIEKVEHPQRKGLYITLAYAASRDKSLFWAFALSAERSGQSSELGYLIGMIFKSQGVMMTLSDIQKKEIGGGTTSTTTTTTTTATSTRTTSPIITETMSTQIQSTSAQTTGGVTITETELSTVTRTVGTSETSSTTMVTTTIVEEVTVTVEKPPVETPGPSVSPLFLVILFISLILVAGSFLYYKRRARPLPPPPPPPPTAALRCPYCGSPISPNAIFCPSCGRRLK